MKLEPSDIDLDAIENPERKLKYQFLEDAMKQPGRTFFVGHLSKQAFNGLKVGKTQLPGDKTRFTFKQDLSQEDPNNSGKFAVYVKYK